MQDVTKHNLAPVVLFVYNRPEHTLRTLNALSLNKLASNTTLHIFSDGPKANASETDLHKIEQVRKICRQKNWCGKVVLHEKDKNQGLAQSIINGLSMIWEENESAIILEDDILTSTGFLLYMNEALNKYQNSSDVFGIAGNSFTSDTTLDDYFFLPIASSWGWATWKRVWPLFETNADKLIQELKAKNLVKEFDFGGFPYFHMLNSQAEGKIDSWAIRFNCSLFLHKGLFLFPRLPFTENIGFDNSGTHCDDNNLMAAEKISDELKFHWPEPSLKQKNVEVMRNFFLLKNTPQISQNGIFNRINNKLKRIINSIYGL